MSLSDVTDWHSYIRPDTQIQNCQFVVQEPVTDEDGTVRVLSGKMDGHRQLLAAANTVFRSLFYGPSPPAPGDPVLVEVMIEDMSRGEYFVNSPDKCRG